MFENIFIRMEDFIRLCFCIGWEQSDSKSADVGFDLGSTTSHLTLGFSLTSVGLFPPLWDGRDQETQKSSMT